jgi:hypothetical protein
MANATKTTLVLGIIAPFAVAADKDWPMTARAHLAFECDTEPETTVPSARNAERKEPHDTRVRSD